MIRFQRQANWSALAASLVLASLTACFNAPHGGSSDGPRYGSGNVKANDQGGDTVNGTVRVPDGQRTGDVATVNGSIMVGDNAAVANAETNNGSISLGSRSTANSLSTVNGSISLEDGARVSQAVQAVNGSLTLHRGADVGGSLGNINGAINLSAAHVGGRITTANGDITIEAGSRVDGGILVEKPEAGWFHFTSEPRIVIGPGSVVTGELRFDRKVELYVSDKATIGPVIGATPLRYPGEGPIG